MDPNTALDNFFGAATEREALEAAVSLLTWLAHGGFRPNRFAVRMADDAPRKLDELAASQPDHHDSQEN